MVRLSLSTQACPYRTYAKLHDCQKATPLSYSKGVMLWTLLWNIVAVWMFYGKFAKCSSYSTSSVLYCYQEMMFYRTECLFEDTTLF